MPLTFVTINQAAETLGLAASTLRRQARLGKLAAHKIGRDWYVTSGEVERYRRDVQRKGEAA
jgi:excisionase family DNA binding protein